MDARYLAGEAEPYAQVWSVVTSAYEALNRRVVPRTTTDCVFVDRRKEVAFGPSDLIAYTGTGLEVDRSFGIFLEQAHDLSSKAAVVTYVARETTQGGGDAEWRGVALLAVDGDKICRCEVYEQSDLGAALDRFDRLSRRTPQPENAASRVFEHVWSHYAAGDWDAVAATVADGYLGTDHRHVVNAGVQQGRDVVVRDLRAAADVGFAISMVSALAIRGECLVLALVRAQGPDVETIQNDALNVVEVVDGRIKTVVVYDVEDFDSALGELETQYVAGEAAQYANTWSVVTGAYASICRNEFPPLASDAVSIDHRRERPSFAAGELGEYIRVGFELNQDVYPYVEAVHRLNESGAVVTYAARGVPGTALTANGGTSRSRWWRES